MRLPVIFSLILGLWLSRYVIIAVAYVFLGAQITSTLGLIYEAKVNQLYTFFGAKEPYLLPARTQTEGQTTLNMSPTSVTTTRKGTRYTFQVTGTIENRGPWPVDNVTVLCYYSLGQDGGEAQAGAMKLFDVAPGATGTYGIEVTTGQTDDRSGVTSVECKSWGHIKDAWAS